LKHKNNIIYNETKGGSEMPDNKKKKVTPKKEDNM
jgi:hypothetical protein